MINCLYIRYTSYELNHALKKMKAAQPQARRSERSAGEKGDGEEARPRARRERDADERESIEIARRTRVARAVLI